MNILIIAGFFPPYAPNSATRIPALAQYLLEGGHDIRVLAARNTLMVPTLSHRLPSNKVIFAPVIEAREFKPRDTHPEDCDTISNRFDGTILALLSIPDMRIGWLPYAVSAGLKLATEWAPDIVFVSAPPHSGLLVAKILAKKLRVPWVAEFRDLWTDHPYYDRNGLIKHFEQWLERWTLRSASGLVTVTRGWAKFLNGIHPQPVCCVLNGYDEADFEPNITRLESDGPLTITYAGALYGGKRSPKLLFEAISQLGWTANDIKIKFYVDAPGLVKEIALKYDLSDHVESYEMIQRDQILKIQQESDILLLMRWDDPGEDHVLAGKLFEYIGCRRPILSIGRGVGEAADIIRKYGLGTVATDTDTIKNKLNYWLDEKRSGGVREISGLALEKFSRRHQFADLESFFESFIDNVNANVAEKNPIAYIK